MRTSTISGAPMFSVAVLVLGLTFGSAVSAQSQVQSQPCAPAATQGGNAQQQSPQSVSQAGQNVKDSFKSLGSVFSKKTQPAAGSTAAPCPPPAALAANSPVNSSAGTPNPPQAAASALIPPAPAGGLDPSKLPDIEGIHLGATPAVAIPQIKALEPGPNVVQIATAQYVSTPDPKWNAYVYTNATFDKIMATFSAPPNKQALVSLERDTVFQVGQQPTLDTIKTALFQKYGANPVQVSTGTTLPAIWVWTFNEQGGPMVPAPPATFARQILSCGATIIAPKANIQAHTPAALPLDAQTMKQWMTMRCNTLGIYVVATFYGSSMSVVMNDTAEDMRDALAGQQYIEKVNAAKQQNLQKDTQKNVPTL
jgi:hypothetical protein